MYLDLLQVYLPTTSFKISRYTDPVTNHIPSASDATTKEAPAREGTTIGGDYPVAKCTGSHETGCMSFVTTETPFSPIT